MPEWFYVFKHIFKMVFMPLPLTLLMLSLAWLLLMRGRVAVSRRILLLTIVFFVLNTLPLFTFHYLRDLELTYPRYQDTEKQVDTIVVLGCWHNEDSAEPLVANIASCSLRRSIEALRLSRVYPSAQIILSGHKLPSQKYSNPAYQGRLLEQLGLQKSRIRVVSGAHDTASEARLILPLIRGKKNLLVTSASHMKRAMNIFNGLGVKMVPVPADYMTSDAPSTGFHLLYKATPSSSGLVMAERSWYEFFGLTWQKLKNLVKSEEQAVQQPGDSG